MALIRYKGRNVSARWYKRYVVGVAPEKAVRPVRRRRFKLASHARFYLPALPSMGEEAETRIVNVSLYHEQEWVKDMQSGYADLFSWGDAPGIPTFFPDLLPRRYGPAIPLPVPQP